MSKLFKLKEWLTVPEAAKHLSGMFSEEVTEADVLRLALDERLRLSVNFVNHTVAHRGEFISWEDTNWLVFQKLNIGTKEQEDAKDREFSCSCTQLRNDRHDDLKIYREQPRKLAELWNEIPEEERWKYQPLLISQNIDGEKFANFEKRVASLDGVWDLLMLGGEQIDVEYKYQQLTNGPEVTLQNIDGSFVVSPDGKTVCQLLTDFEDNEYSCGSKASLEELKRKIVSNKIGKEEADKLLDKHKEDRAKFKEEYGAYLNPKRYYPAGGLPQDSVLVVRTEALREFEQSLNDSPSVATKVSDNTLVSTIAALLAAWPGGKPPSGKDLEKAAASIGVSVSDDSIRKALNLAKEIAPSLKSA